MMRRMVEFLLPIFSRLCTLILSVSATGIIGYLVYKGASGLHAPAIFGDTPPLQALIFRQPVFYGLFPAICGTILLVIFSVGIALPLGVSGGIYMAELASPGIRHWFGLAFDILSGLPSIVIGLTGFSVTVFLHKHFFSALFPCLLVSALSLSFLVMPYLVRSTQMALESIPRSVRMTGLALGATRMQNIFRVLIPHSLSGIMSGIILAIGRCAEDTAVIMLTGAVATAGVPDSMFDSYEALPFYIFYMSSQYANAQELSSGFSAALILILICVFLYSLSLFIQRRLSGQLFYRF